jgi:hypothetical protein
MPHDALRDGYLSAVRDDEVLSEQSRSFHRSLLIASSIAILVAWLNLRPTKISALGVSLQTSDFHAIKIGLLVVVLYFLVAFVSSATVDYVAWLSTHRQVTLGRSQVREGLPEWKDRVLTYEDESKKIAAGKWSTAPQQLREAQSNVTDFTRRNRLYRVVVPANRTRGVIAFVVPVVVGIAAVVYLSVVIA